MVFFRLVISRIHIQVDGVQSRIILAVYFVNNLDRIPAYQGLEFREGNDMGYIIFISDLE